MSCPFCIIASGIAPSPSPAIVDSPLGSAYPVLSTPLVIAFLDIAPVSAGHVLVCPREHRGKFSEMTALEAAAVGFWVRTLSLAVMRAVGDGTEGSWNVLSANGASAGQTVPHAHTHIIPRLEAITGGMDKSMTDDERRNLALGEGPRVRLDREEGERLCGLIKTEVAEELEMLKGEGVLNLGEGLGELWATVPASGLRL